MVADFQTSMQELREANDDFVSFLLALKKLVAGDGPVDFTFDGETVSLPSLPSLIKQYRDGQFAELVLKSESGGIHLKNVNGVLSVTDATGALAPIEAAGLKYSFIERCTMESVDVQECTVDKVEALGGLSFDHASTRSLEVKSLSSSAANVDVMDVGNLNVARAQVQELQVGSLVLKPMAVQEIFASKVTGPYDYRIANTAFTAARVGVQVGFHYVCQLSAPGWKDPNTMGFVDLPVPAGDSGNPQGWLIQAPDMIKFRGNTDYGRYADKYCLNCYSMGGSLLSVAHPGQVGVKSEGNYVPFSQVLSWPWKSVARDPSQYPAATGLPSLPQGTDGLIFVHEAPEGDLGRVIYIETFANPWKVARRLTNTYQAGVIVSSSFSMLYDIPPYTCLRLRVQRVVTQSASTHDVHTILELT